MYPSPLLKFSVFDENPHKTPSASTTPAYVPPISAAPLGAQAHSASHLDFRLSDAISGATSGAVTNANASMQTSPTSVSFYHIPPPPIIFPSNVNMDVDTNDSPTVTSTTIGPDGFWPPQSQTSQTRKRTHNQTPRLAVSQAKSEIQALMTSFKMDIDRVVDSTFGPSPSVLDTLPSSVLFPRSHCSLHGQVQRCPSCDKQLGSVWFSCRACPLKLVCILPLVICLC